MYVIDTYLEPKWSLFLERLTFHFIGQIFQSTGPTSIHMYKWLDIYIYTRVIIMFFLLVGWFRVYLFPCCNRRQTHCYHLIPLISPRSSEKMSSTGEIVPIILLYTKSIYMVVSFVCDVYLFSNRNDFHMDFIYITCVFQYMYFFVADDMCVLFQQC